MVLPHGGQDHRQIFIKLFGKVLTSYDCPALRQDYRKKIFLIFGERLNLHASSGISPPHAFMHLHFCMLALAPLRAAFSASRTLCEDASGLEENRESESYRSCICYRSCVTHVDTYMLTIAILAKAQSFDWASKIVLWFSRLNYQLVFRIRFDILVFL